LSPLVPTKANLEAPAIVRSAHVPTLDSYRAYKPYLRYDFLHCCAYCTVSEAEASAVRFTIDHYEPQTARADLANEYSNLMWCCDECNMRKGDLTPPANARAAGIRFFRPDQDISADHFQLDGLLLKHRSEVGNFTIDYVDLNRLALRRLRDIRRRLMDCEKFVQDGVFALRRAQIDRLPRELRGKVVTAIARAASLGEQLSQQIDDILRAFAKSELIDPDPESAERAADRKTRMKEQQGLFEGKWRGRDF
jgi:uncharacterized protein (TIGR02646 family)